MTPILSPRPTALLRADKSVFLSVIIGAGIGIMPATSEMVPLIFVVLSLACFWIEPGQILRRNYRSALPLLLYLAVQMGMNIYHGSIANGDGFAQGYFVQIIMALLILRLFSMTLIDNHLMIYSAAGASFISILLVFIQYYNWGGIPVCRADAYSGNAQWVSAFQVLTLAALLIYWQKHNLRFSIVIYVLILISFVSIGAMSGARMALYSLFIFLTFRSIFLIAVRHYQFAIKTFGVAMIGVVLTYFLAAQSLCSMDARIMDQLRLATKVIQLFTRSDANVEKTLGKIPEPTAPASGIPPQPLPIILVGVQAFENQPYIFMPDQIFSNIDMLLTVSVDDESIADTITSAGGSRVQIWKNAFSAIRLTPITGYGQAAEPKIVQTGYKFFAGLTHVHNQYLSWLIWSGVIGLASGLYFIASLAFRNEGRSFGWAFFGLTALLFATETLMLPFNVHVMIVIYCFYLRLTRLSSQLRGGVATA